MQVVQQNKTDYKRCKPEMVLHLFLSNYLTERKENMDCKYVLKDGCMKITMPKEVDHHCAEQLRKEADLLISAYRIKRLIFDFSITEFMDSSGIGVLIGRSKKMGYNGGTVEARNLNGRVEKIFVVSGLHKLIQVTTEEADPVNMV